MYRALLSAINCLDLMNVIDVVLAWDLPDVTLADAVRAQVRAMAGAGGTDGYPCKLPPLHPPVGLDVSTLRCVPGILARYGWRRVVECVGWFAPGLLPGICGGGEGAAEN